MLHTKIEGKQQFHKGSPIVLILRRFNSIPHIDTHFFKIYSNIVLPSQ